MNQRENLLSLYRRQGYAQAPVSFDLCPALQRSFEAQHPGSMPYQQFFGFPLRVIPDPGFPWIEEIKDFVPQRRWSQEWDAAHYPPTPVAEGSRIDVWGIAHEPGGKAAHHMTRMRHPLECVESLEQLQAYPWPEFDKGDWSFLAPRVWSLREAGLAAFVLMECTIWETAWYLRRMDRLMLDMRTEDEKATFLLDKITDLACFRAEQHARADVDILGLGDDLGMQQTLMMSQEMYRTWIKPRLARVIRAAKAVKPDIIIQYHSCGFATPLIGDLIEAGVDVLNPVQSECMDFGAIHAEYGGALSFNGTVGTQTVMPFGSPEDVRATVFRNLAIAGEKGGLLCCPTHMLEPEVPWRNIEAYVRACKEFVSVGP